jgi:lantibiotic transport system ATP-binding protein
MTSSTLSTIGYRLTLRFDQESSHMNFSIETNSLTRQFKGGYGVRNLNLRVPQSCIYGFLGPNGAGKSTTIRLLLGLLKPDSGQIRVLGNDIRVERNKALRQIGSMVEDPSLYLHLTGYQNLEVTRRLINVPVARIDEVLSITSMRDAAHRPVKQYSLGMKQRLSIAMSLLNSPQLLILDEPANGLDPAGIADMRSLLKTLVKDHGITVFVSSHQLSEVELIADHVGVLLTGELKFQGTLDELRKQHPSHVYIQCNRVHEACQLLEIKGEQCELLDDHTFCIKHPVLSEAHVNRLLIQSGIEVSHLSRRQPSLEEMFMKITSDAKQMMPEVA